MNELEKFIAKYDDKFYFHFDEEMSDELSGMIIGRDIYVNKHKPLTIQLSTIAEEVGHYFTSSHKNITNYDKHAKDEAMARRWSYGQLIPVDHIARYQDSEDAVLLYEIAEDLELPENIVESAIYMYKVQGKI
ncbi:ImmA/IrrE family metallo-endopeptidase [Aerococcus urinaeequi]|uniref:ImmA/IrrE family metallo-endopeptidase n=1 Tax=Aerococcus urinaeequi TaxID=51665 RepID=UPI003D6A1BDB